MISCKRASELSSLSLDRKLSMIEKLSLCWHTFLCKICRKYGEQLRLIDRQAKNWAKHPEKYEEESEGEGLSSEAKERIICSLQGHS